jgi:hypothetical protein
MEGGGGGETDMQKSVRARKDGLQRRMEGGEDAHTG